MPKRPDRKTDDPVEVLRVRLIVLAAVLVFSLWAVWEASGFGRVSRWVPLIASVGAAAFCLIGIIQNSLQLRRATTAPARPRPARPDTDRGPRLKRGAESGPECGPPQREGVLWDPEIGRYLAWFAAAGSALIVFGGAYPAGVFVFLFLRLEARAGWLMAATSGIATTLVMTGLVTLRFIRLPPGLLW